MYAKIAKRITVPGTWQRAMEEDFLHNNFAFTRTSKNLRSEFFEIDKKSFEAIKQKIAEHHKAKLAGF